MEKLFGHTRVMLELCDITKIKVQAVINSANPVLKGGGGVDGAIQRAGGHSILKECRAIIDKIGSLAPGKAVVTQAGRLPAEYVIHTVGPVWRGGQQGEPAILRSAYLQSLVLAEKMAVKTLAFPSLATGVYGYPIRHAAEIALKTIRDYLLPGKTCLETVIMALFSRDDLKIYEDTLEHI